MARHRPKHKSPGQKLVGQRGDGLVLVRAKVPVGEELKRSMAEAAFVSCDEEVLVKDFASPFRDAINKVAQELASNVGMVVDPNPALAEGLTRGVASGMKAATNFAPAPSPSARAAATTSRTRGVEGRRLCLLPSVLTQEPIVVVGDRAQPFACLRALRQNHVVARLHRGVGLSAPRRRRGLSVVLHRPKTTRPWPHAERYPELADL